MHNFSKMAVRAAVSLALFGSVSMANAADTIKIGIAGPLTGPVAQYGDMQFTGGKMAVEQINKAGGIKGKQIEAVIYDDACDPKQAVAIANKVINDGVKFVVGHLCSDNTLPASDIYEDEGVLMVTPASTNPKITERGYQLTLRTIGLDSDQGPTAAKYIIEQVKPQRVAVIHDKKQYGEGIASSVKAALDKAGVKVVAYEGITAGDKDFSALIAKLQKENVDFVYYGGYHPELGLILRQAKEKGLNAKFMGPEGVGNESISQIAQGASEGLLVTLPKSFDTDPANKAIVEEFTKNKQDPTGPFVFPAYSAVEVIAGGITAAKSEDTAKVAAAIHAGSFKTPTGDLSFDAKGDLKDFKFVVYEWHFGKPKTEVSPQ